MMQNLGSILIGLAAILSIGVVYSIARRIFLGALAPVEITKLLSAQEERIRLLQEQNESLNSERVNEKAQLMQMLKDATEANFAIYTFLHRYEALDGFASGPIMKRREPPKSPTLKDD